MSTYTSPLLATHGTFPATGADAGVAAHYGDPAREQRLLARATEPVIVDYSQLGLVTVTGEDRASWLTTLSSQVMTAPTAFRGADMLLLSVQGRIDFYAHALEADETIWLILESNKAQELTDYLNRMKFMLRVEVTNRSSEYAVVGSRQDFRALAQAPEILRDAYQWRDPWPGVVDGGYSYSAPEEHPGQGYRWFYYIIDRNRLLELADSCSLAGSWAADALRIEAWRPRYGYEVDAKTIPHELDLLRTAVHLNKGCYKGQETVARVHNLGHPPRRLTFLDLDGTEHTLPPAGSGVYAGNKKVGTLTSVAQHYEAGPIGLAVLKRTVDPAATLTVREEVSVDDGRTRAQTDYAAAQTLIVEPDAGQVAGRRNMGDFFRG